jgi:KaiC/GvpD/RAD55 family RecA-like ATPase
VIGFENIRRTSSAKSRCGLRKAVREDKLSIIYLRPLDLSVDETLEEIRRSVARIGATRVVIDSISGFEMALAPTFREDFRESLYRLIGALTGLGVTMFSTVEVAEGHAGLQLTGYQISFLTDDILSLRYVEIEGELRKALVVVKMRSSSHSRAFRIYEISATGVQLRESSRTTMASSPVCSRQLRVPHPFSRIDGGGARAGSRSGRARCRWQRSRQRPADRVDAIRASGPAHYVSRKGACQRRQAPRER